jgi:hypothetical protein
MNFSALDTRGGAESADHTPCRVSPFGSDRGLSPPPQTPDTPCTSVAPVPSGARSGQPGDNNSIQVDEAWQRLCEDTDKHLYWDPNTSPQQRFNEGLPIQVQNRGLTPQTPFKQISDTLVGKQLEIWKTSLHHAETIASKLDTQGMHEEAASLKNCHTFFTVAVCQNCHKAVKFPNRCDRFYCPQCASHLHWERQKQVSWWTGLIAQPKHVVLTCRNIPDLCAGHVAEMRAWFTRLRRRKFAKNWVGGFYRIEVTNEGRGWHLHIHALINAAWIDAPTLAMAWGSITGAMGYIVKVRDCRGTSYLSEVTKYVAKAPQIASWCEKDVATFVHAFQGQRTFGVFGELFGARTEFAEFIATLKAAKGRCECGCQNRKYYTENEFFALDCVPEIGNTPRAPPKKDNQIQLLSPEFRWPD